MASGVGLHFDTASYKAWTAMACVQDLGPDDTLQERGRHQKVFSTMVFSPFAKIIQTKYPSPISPLLLLLLLLLLRCLRLLVSALR
jgi:hypothetical protein